MRYFIFFILFIILVSCGVQPYQQPSSPPPQEDCEWEYGGLMADDQLIQQAKFSSRSGGFKASPSSRNRSKGSTLKTQPWVGSKPTKKKTKKVKTWHWDCD